MPEFLNLLPPGEAYQKFVEKLVIQSETEIIKAADAVGRVTGRSVLAPHPLPAFVRSAVDGYAVRAADTYGANEGLPAYFRLVGEVQMGKPAVGKLARGECVLIHTGGMVPEGADAVVMLEYTQQAADGEIEVLRAAAVSENLIELGEDVREGEEVIPAGKRLRPADIGGLMALGITSIEVTRKPTVGILSSGDEVVPPETEPSPGQVRDVNSYTLSALVSEAGGIPRLYGVIPDRAEALESAARSALGECDLVVITAGSSASARDLTSQVIDRLGKPGVLVHGVNVRPGKPTILGVCGGKGVVGLPGNPVSALVIAGLFVRPVVAALSGEKNTTPAPSVKAKLSINLPSQAGREDWVPVRLVAAGGWWEAEPVFGKSNLIFTLARADGLVRIHPDANGIPAGENVEVFIL